MNYLSLFYIVIALLLTSSSYALTSFGTNNGGDVTLTPPQPPKPEIFGIQFDRSPLEITKILAQSGLTLKSQESKGPHNLITILNFSGIPQDLTIREGNTQLLFFRNKLTRIDITFTPTYRNFLIIRNQLFQSLGKRFSISKKHESMDNLLRTQLAHKQKKTLDEQAVKESLLTGKTFFFYSIQDRQNTLNIRYSLATTKTSPPQPQLLLHYSLKTQMKEMQTFHEQQKIQLLPKRR